MSRRNPPRQAALQKTHPSYCIKSLFSSRPSPVHDSNTNSPNTNRKRATDESITQPPAKRLSNATRSTSSETDFTVGSEVAQPASRLKTNQATVQSNQPNSNTESITRRIIGYKSTLQALEADRKTVSQNIDPEALTSMRRLLDATVSDQTKVATKLRKIEGAMNQMTNTIATYRDVVPTQLYEAHKAIKTDQILSKRKLRETQESEAKQRKDLEDAERKHREASVKLEEPSKQIHKCKLNLRSAEQDLNNVLLEQRLDNLSRVNISKLPYDQRLHLSKLVEQATAVLGRGSGKSRRNLRS